MSKAEKIEKQRSLAEQSSDVWCGLYDMLENSWWVVKTFNDYVILYFDGSHYSVNYSYDDDGEVVFADRDQWVEVKEEWVAKKMRETLDGQDDDPENIEKTDDDSEELDDTTDDNVLNIEVEFIAKSQKKQLVYSVVYEPDTVDSQGDWAEADEIEKMAHGFLSRHLVTGDPVADHEHEIDLELDEAVLVESYIAPVDFGINDQIIKKDSWVAVLHVPNSELWKKIEDGEITGYSMAGKGLRIPEEM